jgi:uncharacterized membrane protein YidH (DUF202 family)
MKALGIVLMIAGVLALAYGGFSWTTHKKAIDMGPLQVEREQRHTMFLPPILGVGALVIGGVLVFAVGKKS